MAAAAVLPAEAGLEGEGGVATPPGGVAFAEGGIKRPGGNMDNRFCCWAGLIAAAGFMAAKAANEAADDAAADIGAGGVAATDGGLIKGVAWLIDPSSFGFLAAEAAAS